MPDDPSTERDAEAELLAAYLADRHIPCPKCQYDLRGVRSGTCPECGEKIIISVGHVDHSTMPWIIAVAFYGLASGVSGVFVFLGMMILLFEGPLDADDVVFVAAGASAFAASATGLVVIAKRREQIWAASTLAQIMIVMSVLLVPVIAVIAAVAVAAIVY